MIPWQDVHLSTRPSCCSPAHAMKILRSNRNNVNIDYMSMLSTNDYTLKHAEGHGAGAPPNLPPWPAYTPAAGPEPCVGPQAYPRAFADADISASMAEQWARPQPATAVEPRGVSPVMPDGYPPPVCGPDPCDTAPYSSPGWPPLSLKPCDSSAGPGTSHLPANVMCLSMRLDSPLVIRPLLTKWIISSSLIDPGKC